MPSFELSNEPLIILLRAIVFLAKQKTENCTKYSACTKTLHQAQFNSVTLIAAMTRNPLQNYIFSCQRVHTSFNEQTEYTVNIPKDYDEVSSIAVARSSCCSGTCVKNLKFRSSYLTIITSPH